MGFERSGWRVDLDGAAAFRTASNSAGVAVTLDDYVVANLGLVCEVEHGVELNLKLHNLFDADSETVAGYPMPGFTVRGGLAIRMY